MKNKIYTLALAVLAASCGGKSPDTIAVQDSTNVDSTAVVVPNIEIDLEGLLNKFKITASQPFVQDTSFLSGLAASDSTALTTDEVTYLSYNFLESDISYNGISAINDVFFFDSLETNNEYEGYLEVIDIGMMQSSNAYVAQKLILNDSITLLLWYVDFATYEACPYFSGRNLYATIFKDNQAQSCTLIGEDSGGGDAPYWSETRSLFSAIGDQFTVSLTDRNGGDVDEAGNDIVSETVRSFALQIVNGKWVVTETTEPTI